MSQTNARCQGGGVVLPVGADIGGVNAGELGLVVGSDGLLRTIDQSGTQRLVGPGAYWSQTTWYYNGTTGNDLASGSTLGTALKTMGELFRRMGYATVLTDVTLNIVGGAASLSASEAAILDALTIGPRQWTIVDI